MENFIIKGPAMPINIRKSLGEYFWDIAVKNGDRIFQIHADTGATETFKLVQKKAVRVAIELKQNGVNPKDIVMICCENIFDNIIPYLASLFIGSYTANLIPTIDLYGAKNILSDLKPSVLFVSEKKLNIFKVALDALNLLHPQIYIIGDPIPPFKSLNQIYENPVRDERYFTPEKVNVHETALILFSSGTTSRPKGICVSHITVFGPFSTYIGLENLMDRPVVPIVQYAPLCYISSLWTLGASIVFACPRIIGPNIGVELFLKLLEKYKVINCFLVHDIAVNIATFDENIVKKYDLSSVNYISVGGSFVHPKYIARLREIFSKAIISPVYGTTELGTVPFTWALVSPDGRGASYDHKLDSVGVVNQNCEVKVIDVNTGKAVGPNQKGEILVKSPYRMNGYYNQSQTRQPFDEEGFLHTGDLGSYDEEGFFYILDRLSRCFKYQGSFIHPGLVEERLIQHPSVKGAVIIKLPDDLDGYRAMACVVLKQNCIATEKELGDFIVEKMGEYYRPTAGFTFLHDLPVNGNGKIDFVKLKMMYNTEYGTKK